MTGLVQRRSSDVGTHCRYASVLCSAVDVWPRAGVSRICCTSPVPCSEALPLPVHGALVPWWWEAARRGVACLEYCDSSFSTTLHQSQRSTRPSMVLMHSSTVAAMRPISHRDAGSRTTPLQVRAPRALEIAPAICSANRLVASAVCRRLDPVIMPLASQTMLKLRHLLQT